MFPPIPVQAEHRDQRCETKPHRQPPVQRRLQERCADYLGIEVTDALVTAEQVECLKCFGQSMSALPDFEPQIGGNKEVATLTQSPCQCGRVVTVAVRLQRIPSVR